MAYAYILLTSKETCYNYWKLGSLSQHRFSTQMMNLCIVFNSFSVIWLQQIQRGLHFTLDNESLHNESWRATKTVWDPRAHILWIDTDKLGLLNLVKRHSNSAYKCLRGKQRQKNKTILGPTSWYSKEQWPQIGAWDSLADPNSVSGLSASVKAGIYSFRLLPLCHLKNAFGTEAFSSCSVLSVS